MEALLNWTRIIINNRPESISYMVNMEHAGEIENEKFTKWRLKLALYNFDTV